MGSITSVNAAGTLKKPSNTLHLQNRQLLDFPGRGTVCHNLAVYLRG